MNIIEEFKSNGWSFQYEGNTHFIGAYHPQGGKQSICEIIHPFNRDQFGEAIVDRMCRGIQLKDILDWAEHQMKLARTDGAKTEETRIAWAILNAPR